MDDSRELAYVGSVDMVIAMDRLTGREAWRVKLSYSRGGRITALVTHGNELYAAYGASVHCLNRMTGALVWKSDVKPVTPLGPVLLALAGAHHRGAIVDSIATTGSAAAIVAQQGHR